MNEEELTGIIDEESEAIPEDFLTGDEVPAIVRNFATIGAVYEDGVSLIFDGESEATEKHYLCNAEVTFRAGDRVRILADSGTYVVEYVVGAPMSRPTGMPDGGSNGQVLTKISGDDYSTAWQSIPKELPAVGTSGYVLTKTLLGVAWQEPSAERATELINQYSSTSQGNTNYDIQIRCAQMYTSSSPVFEIRMKGSSTWKKIALQ